MSFLEGIFGKKTDATGPSQENSVKLDPALQKIFDLAMPYAKQYAKEKPKIFEGDTVAGFNSNDLDAQQQALGAVPAVQSTAANAKSANDNMLSADFLNPETNPFLQKYGQTLTSNIQRQWAENGAKTLRNEDVAAGGAYGGGNSRNMIADILGQQGTDRTAADALTTLYNDAWKTNLGAQQQAVSQAPQVQQQQLLGAGVTGAVGQQQRAMQQAKLDAEVAKFNAQQGLKLSKSQDIFNLVSGAAPFGSKASSSVTPGQPANDPVKTALGLGFGALGSLF
jgi:hypothetical protein